MNHQEVKNLYLTKGYRFREEKMALNPFFIRSRESKSDKFDDWGGVAFINQVGEPHLFEFACTTDPGKHYLQAPMNKDGTLIIVPGQYIEVFGRGLHNGSYECLKQVGQILYVRDYNKDTKLDFDLYRDPEKRKIYTFWGVYGTNVHRASMWKKLLSIGLYSAGCIVLQDPEKFRQLIELRDASVKYSFTKWDLTLFEE